MAMQFGGKMVLGPHKAMTSVCDVEITTLQTDKEPASSSEPPADRPTLMSRFVYTYL